MLTTERGDVRTHSGQCEPDETIVVRRGGLVVGQASCWWRNTARYAGARAGAIGHYTAIDGAAGAVVLSRACRTLAREGCTVAVGPMDGSTWHGYRFVVERGSEPAFFLEPDTPATWPAHWVEQGFSPVATYTSAIADRLDIEPRAIPRACQRIAAAGISIRPLDVTRADEELRKLFGLSQLSFRRNFLYSPIAYDQFRQLYASLLLHVRPELVLMAERHDVLLGFVLAVPDLLQAQRGASIDTVIVKTIAVHPGVAGIGLGGVLVALVHRRAHELGLRRAIHALMHDDNVSRGISDRFARPFRRYALFAKALTSA
jgi:GNAT superfamily N-acetyltransferase